MLLKKKRFVAESAAERFHKSVTVAGSAPHFAGVVAVVFTYVRCVCMRMFGGCPAMVSPGNVRTVENKMGLEISNYNLLVKNFEYHTNIRQNLSEHR